MRAAASSVGRQTDVDLGAVSPRLTALFCRATRAIRSRPRVFSALLASVLIVATFPDVFVAGTSLRLSDQLWGSYEDLASYRAHPLVSASLPWLPVPYGAWLLSYNDIGGAIEITGTTDHSAWVV